MAKHSNKTTENQYIKAILTNDIVTLKKIYQKYFPKIFSMVKLNNGNLEDAQDVFQEAMVVILKKASQKDFNLNTEFYSYLYSVSKFIWLRQLKKKHRTEVTLDNEEGLVHEDQWELITVEGERRKLYLKFFAQLGKDCQDVLRLFFEGKKLKTIAETKNYSIEYAKRKKYKCKEELVAKIKNSDTFKELVND